MEEYLTIKEFAGLLSIHPNTVRRSIKNGKLQCVRIGTGERAGYRIPRSEISRIALFDLKDMVKKILDGEK
jgi:excisionase family DNA binding protein